MEVYTTDDERVEEIKKWWKENGTSLLTGIVLGLGLLFGYRGWVEYQDNIKEQASAIFTRLQLAVQQDDIQNAQSLAGKLTGNFGGTSYAVLSSLSMAKLKVEQGDFASASTHIQWALEHSEDPNIQNIARLRLARVLLAQGKPEEAGAIFASVKTGDFSSLVNEVTGDILLKQGKPDQARDAYLKSLSTLAPTSQNRMLIQMKLDDLSQNSQDAQS